MHIYLSPHHDDVCYSVGDRAGRTGGELVTAFTVSHHTQAPIDLPADPRERAGIVTELRRREDMRFAASAGLNRHELGLPEPPVVGLNPFGLTGMREEVDQLLARLMPCLEQLLEREGDGERAEIYCPMAIGGHRNHVSMLLAVRDGFETLGARCDLFLYEDLHYASHALVRWKGLGFAKDVFEGFDLTPIVEELDAAAAGRKLEWIGFYATQHPRPLHMTDFTPASGLSARAHEIVWRVSRSDLD